MATATIISESVAAAQTAPTPEQDEQARIAFMARRRQAALSIAETEKLRESARRGRPVYWREHRVTLPPEFANPLTGDRSYVVKCQTGQKADATAGDRYTAQQLSALANHAAVIAAGLARKKGLNISPDEREAIGAEVALSVLARYPDGMPKGDRDGDDLAYLAATAGKIIADGDGESGHSERGSWRDASGDLPWGSVPKGTDATDRALTLADVIADEDVSLAAEQSQAESDPYLADARAYHRMGWSYPSPQWAGTEAAIALTGCNKSERQALGAALSSAPSADWLRAAGKEPTRQARRDWRKSRDRGLESIRKRIANGDAERFNVLADGEREQSTASSIREPGISSSQAARAYSQARRADSPSREWQAREIIFRSCVVTPKGQALRQSLSRKQRAGVFASPANATVTISRTNADWASTARTTRQRPYARGNR